MFNKLKEKLSGFTKSLGKQIEEKAVPVEPPQEQIAESPLRSSSQPYVKNHPLVDTKTETKNDTNESENAVVSDLKTDIKKLQTIGAEESWFCKQGKGPGFRARVHFG